MDCESYPFSVRFLQSSTANCRRSRFSTDRYLLSRLCRSPRQSVSLCASTTSPPRSPSAERSSLGTTPNIAMAGSRCSPRTTSITIEPRACWSSAGGPSSRLDPSSRTLRSRDPTTGSPSPSRLDQPTCDTHNRRNCSVNRNRHCLKVVDRFRRPRAAMARAMPIRNSRTATSSPAPLPCTLRQHPFALLVVRSSPPRNLSSRNTMRPPIAVPIKTSYQHRRRIRSSTASGRCRRSRRPLPPSSTPSLNCTRW